MIDTKYIIFFYRLRKTNNRAEHVLVVNNLWNKYKFTDNLPNYKRLKSYGENTQKLNYKLKWIQHIKEKLA